MRTSPQPSHGYQSSGGGASGGGGNAFDTDIASMDAAKRHLNEVGAAMTAQVDRLMGQLEALNPRTWDGSAYRQFLQSKAQWHSEHDIILKALHDIEDRMHSSARHYERADMDTETTVRNATGGAAGAGGSAGRTR